ncbi:MULTISPECIES: ATP-binding protein [Halorussus]|uniref:ATP-binding protein n=1 Tax=Halorussus TaxID=1070314 RepID=UPI00209E80FC|nr:ATP-binding protein [Halorussus vallis]USZ74953.1 ATP-binding protein [Halorussus vallis]
MLRRLRFRSPRSAEFAITLLGIVLSGVAIGRFPFAVVVRAPFAEAVIHAVLVGAPGLVLVYGGLRLSESGIDPEAYPRVAHWCFGGVGVLLVGLGLLGLNPAGRIANPVEAGIFATAIGGVGGFTIGLHDAQAVTRAEEAEAHQRRLRRQKQALERQNEQLESFASMLAHELRNPLQIAQIYLQQIPTDDGSALAEVEHAHDRIEEMIDILLVTARRTDPDISWEAVPLADVCTETWSAVETNGAELAVETDRTIRADPLHLRHLLENLCKNAVEHSSTSPRRNDENAVEHGDWSPTVRVGDLPDGFFVADDGPGIPEDERETVFDAGYSTRKDGIGLGLTFVARLADTYGWECAATESEAGGARFEFRNVELVESEGR